MKAYGAFSRYSYSGISPLAYFYTIARNTIIDHRRKKHLIIAEEDELLAVSDTSPGPQEEAMQAESGEAIRLIISQLSEDQQDVVVLRFIEGRSTKEIAELLGKTEEAVRKLQSRALHIVKKKISHE
jgi:RNA polymerase sigma-70 factor (ECF subfamily)